MKNNSNPSRFMEKKPQPPTLISRPPLLVINDHSLITNLLYFTFHTYIPTEAIYDTRTRVFLMCYSQQYTATICTTDFTKNHGVNCALVVHIAPNGAHGPRIPLK